MVLVNNSSNIQIEPTSTFAGKGAGNLTATGVNNTAYGANALSTNTAGTDNIAIGFNALNVNTASANTAIGSQAMTANTTGTPNVAIGGSALAANTTGGNHVAIGFQSLTSNTTGDSNIAIGYQSMFSNTTGPGNVAVGIQAMFANTIGGFNTAFATGALLSCTSGNFNCGFGVNAFWLITTGIENIGLGFGAGSNCTGADSNNIHIGNAGILGDNGTIRIGGKNGLVGAAACFISGINAVAVVGAGVMCDAAGQLGNVVSSIEYKKNVADIEEETIMNLRPVSFNYKDEKLPGKHYGFIAEEVEQLFPELVLYDKDNKPYTVAYHEMYALLLKEIQRLNERVKTLESRI